MTKPVIQMGGGQNVTTPEDQLRAAGQVIRRVWLRPVNDSKGHPTWVCRECSAAGGHLDTCRVADTLDRLAAFAAPPVAGAEDDLLAALCDATAVDERIYFNDDRVEHGRAVLANLNEAGYTVAALRSAAPALAPCDCYADHAPECASMGRSAAPPVEVGEDIHAILRDLMEETDWVGTGMPMALARLLTQYERRIEAALRSAAPGHR